MIALYIGSASRKTWLVLSPILRQGPALTPTVPSYPSMGEPVSQKEKDPGRTRTRIAKDSKRIRNLLLLTLFSDNPLASLVIRFYLK